MAKNKFNDNSGPSQRQLRVGELIRRALSEILMQGIIHDPDLNRISVTVSEVSASPDLKIATAYVCPLGGEGGEDLIALLTGNVTNDTDTTQFKEAEVALDIVI